MIKRIVKMTFKSENIDDFIKVFNANKEKIARYNGCISVELLQDIKSENIFFTYSLWENSEALENYRQSELFKSVWSKTKILFSKQAEAWTVKTIN